MRIAPAARRQHTRVCAYVYIDVSRRYFEIARPEVSIFLSHNADKLEFISERVPREIPRYQKFIPLIYPQPLLTSDASLRRDSTNRISSSASLNAPVGFMCFLIKRVNGGLFALKLSVRFYTHTCAQNYTRSA